MHLKKKGKALLTASVVLLTATLLLLGAMYGFWRSFDSSSVETDCLVVYTPHPIAFVKPLVEEFDGRTHIKVKIISGGTGKMTEQLDAGQSIDVMWGGSYFSVAPYFDMFADYRSINEADYLPVNRNTEGNMTRFSDVPSILMVNSDLIGDIEIKGYEDLLNPALKGKIAFANPSRSSSSFEHLINMLYAMGQGNPEAGWDYVKRLCENIGDNLLDSSSEVYNGVTAGKYLVGLTFEEAAVTLRNDGAHIQIIYMQEGVVSTPDGIYLLKGAAHPDEARAFIDFLSGYDAQYLMTQRLGRRSVREDLQQVNDVPEKSELNIIYPDPQEVLQNREDWITRFSEIYKGGLS